MKKDELLILNDEQVEQIVAADDPLSCLRPRLCPEITTLACGEEGPICSAC
jgi:hypothetical protein